MYCLDSNIIIDTILNDTTLKKKLDSIDPNEICITTITVCELFKGAYKSVKSDASVFLINELIGNYKIFTLDLKSAEIFGKDYMELEKKGKLTQTMDLLISSIVKSNGLTLITRNKKDFQNIPNLKVEEW